MNDAILNTALARNLRGATLTQSLGESRHGTLRPPVEVRFPKGTSHRKTSAALHALAALAELATPSDESWCVVVDVLSDEAGCVYLELGQGTRTEARSGLAILTAVVA